MKTNHLQKTLLKKNKGTHLLNKLLLTNPENAFLPLLKLTRLSLLFILTTFFYQGNLIAQCFTNSPSSPVGIVPKFIDGNPKICEGGKRFDPPSSGTFNLDGGGTVTIAIMNTNCGQVFSWTVSSNVIIDHIIVKGGPNANDYDYTSKNPRPLTDGNLHAPVNSSGKYAGLSHIDFCYRIKKCEPYIKCPPDITLECSNEAGIKEWLSKYKFEDCGLYGSVMNDFDRSKFTECNRTGMQNVKFTLKKRDGYVLAYCYAKITLVDKTPPKITCPSPPESPIECPKEPVFGKATATDNCDDKVDITIKDVDHPGPCPGTYTRTRTWTAKDDCGNTATCSQSVKVQDTKPPVLMGVPNDATVECDAVPPPAKVTAKDDCDPYVEVEFSEYRKDGDCKYNYVLIREWTAYDDCGYKAWASQKITVKDTKPPVLTCPAPPVSPIECPKEPVFGRATATDNCDDKVDISVKDVDHPGPCKGTYIRTRTWTAKDDCGNTATCSQSVKVQDTKPPVLYGVPYDVTVECDYIPHPPHVTAKDDCDPYIGEVWYMETRINGDCKYNYKLKRTWQAQDDCENKAMAVQIITVRDTKAPVLMGVPADATVECDNVPNPPHVTAKDNCDPYIGEIWYMETRIDGDCKYNYKLKRTWQAQDDCENKAMAVQIITVRDTKAPVLMGVPADATVECDNVPNPPHVTAKDNCDPYIGEVWYMETRIDGNCKYNYTLKRSWQAQDECGNNSMATQTITVKDTKAPVGYCPNLDKMVYSESYFPHPSASDEKVWNLIEQIRACYKDNCGKVIVTLDHWRDDKCDYNYRVGDARNDDEASLGDDTRYDDEYYWDDYKRFNDESRHSYDYVRYSTRTFYFKITDECGNAIHDFCRVKYSARCQDFCTYRHDYWGDRYHKMEDRDCHSVCGDMFKRYGDIRIGMKGCGFIINDENCFAGIMPGDGPAESFPLNFSHGCDNRLNNQIASQLVALIQNIRYNRYYKGLELHKYVLHNSCVVPNSLVSALRLSHRGTVRNLIDMCNKYLACRYAGWCNDYDANYGQNLLTALSTFNEYWDGCYIKKPCANGSDTYNDDSQNLKRNITTIGKGLSVYPNPTSGGFYLNLSDFAGKNGELNIMDATGRLVLNKKFNNIIQVEERLSLDNQPAGLYLISLKVEGDSELKRTKLILNKN